MEPTLENRHALSLSSTEWEETCKRFGQPKFRAGQIQDWIFQKKVLNPDLMSNLPKSLTGELKTFLRWNMPEIVQRVDAEDGASKLLLKGEKNQLIETVIMRYEGRVSLCVSSQVGCKLACSFCQTGKMGFFRHLPKDEILAQYFLADEIVSSEGRRISHIVFMGMGEPLDNYDNVIYSANRFLEPERIHLSHKHVTISTSGINPKIASLATDCKASLAVSLHAARDELRTELMPINRKYPLTELKQELMNYQKVTGKKITLEYILIKDKNCGLKEAKELVKFIHGMRVKVNLIPFNAHPGLPYDRPADPEIEFFSRYLNDRSISAPVRYSKGLDVSAACGQLAAKKMGQFDQVPRRKDLVLGTEPSVPPIIPGVSPVILSESKDLKAESSVHQ